MYSEISYEHEDKPMVSKAPRNCGRRVEAWKKSPSKQQKYSEFTDKSEHNCHFWLLVGTA
jgi:ABC-type uncharacterized transport system substrate-binding protein